MGDTSGIEWGVVWVRTVPELDGERYQAVLEIDEDSAVALSVDTAVAHALYVLTQVQLAEYDAAVVVQITKVTEDRAAAVQVLAELRAGRPDYPPPSDLHLVPGVSASSGAPFLLVNVRGKSVGQWTLADARSHALHVLEAPAGAGLDTSYLRYLVATVGMEPPRARILVDDLSRWRAAR